MYIINPEKLTAGRDDKQIRETRRALIQRGATILEEFGQALTNMSEGKYQGAAAKERFEGLLFAGGPKDYKVAFERVTFGFAGNDTLANFIEVLHLQALELKKRNAQAMFQLTCGLENDAGHLVTMIYGVGRGVNFYREVETRSAGNRWERGDAFFAKHPRVITHDIDPYAGVRPAKKPGHVR